MYLYFEVHIDPLPIYHVYDLVCNFFAMEAVVDMASAYIVCIPLFQAQVSDTSPRRLSKSKNGMFFQSSTDSYALFSFQQHPWMIIIFCVVVMLMLSCIHKACVTSAQHAHKIFPSFDGLQEAPVNVLSWIIIVFLFVPSDKMSHAVRINKFFMQLYIHEHLLREHLSA